jgi:hypothetical protein
MTAFCDSYFWIRLQQEKAEQFNEAERERQRQPVDLSKHNLTYRHVKYGDWQRAFNKN